MPRSNQQGSTLAQSTSWSLILRAQGTGPEARAALGELIARYEKSVLSLIRLRGCPPSHSPEDLKQEFFTRLLAADGILILDRTRGHFRGWLHVAVRRFVANAWREWHGPTKGNGVTEPLLDDVSHDTTPETQYMRAFVEDTLVHVLAQHRAEYRNQERFDALQRFLPGPQMDPVQLEPVARSLGMTPAALAVALFHLRKRYRELLRKAVADTLLLAPLEEDDVVAEQHAEAEVTLELGLMYRSLTEDVASSRASEAS